MAGRKIPRLDRHQFLDIAARRGQLLHDARDAGATDIVVVLAVAWLDLAPFRLRQFPVAAQACLAENVTIGIGIETAQAEGQRHFEAEQPLGEFCRFRPGHRAGFVVQITQAIDDAADLAIRVIDLFQCGFDTLDGVLEQFDQHGGGVRLEQLRQRIRNLVDGSGEGRGLPPIDEAITSRRVVDCPPEGGGDIAASGRALGVEPQRLIKLVIAPGDAQQQLDQGGRWLRRQIRLDVTPGIPPPGLSRRCRGLTLRGLLCQPRQADGDAMLAEIALRGTRAATVASQFATVVPQFDLIALAALDQSGDPVISQPQSPDRADGKIRFATPEGAECRRDFRARPG
jgi:hypothetical protein